MKTNLLALASLLLALTACTSRTITFNPVTHEASYKSQRFGAKETLGELTITVTTNGPTVVTIKSLQSDLVQGISVAASAIAEGMVKGMKP